ncbi:kin of IRRE-like protein 2 [Ischnura elegans]|uniref:kin of IRRE-like protein 2 n=1 Tax=Ischnura elegans TaxID=197161 RepID=UPI001ED8B519|nr:kin of IRRE-like protein 2 [Ischnura elegans]
MGRFGRCLGWMLLCTLACFKGAPGIRLMEVRIPMHTVRDHSARLECHFDMEGESLYSVKWYKDGNEFYRYLPRDMPPAQVFPLPGVAIDILNSTESTVVLSSVNLSSTGRYRCEVSAEAPSFQTVSDHGDMVVVALPEEGPRITGGRPRYQAGDIVRVNCTSGRSKPAAQLMWFINGEQANSSFLRGPFIASDREGLETSTLGLEFKVRPKHFRRGGDMKLKCLATIATVYWRSNEESVEGDRPHKAPALETRKWTQGDAAAAEASSSGEFGADRSGGTSSTRSALTWLHLLLLLLSAAYNIFVSSTSGVRPLDR